jgi:hypothetical protein
MGWERGPSEPEEGEGNKQGAAVLESEMTASNFSPDKQSDEHVACERTSDK